MPITAQNLKVGYGEWRPTPVGSSTAYTGICQRCKGKVPAVELQLKQLAFGKGEEYRCKKCFWAKAGD